MFAFRRIKMLTFQKRCAFLRAIGWGLAIGLLLAVPLVSQVTTGSISGVVTDTTGARIPGADVTVKDLGTNITRAVKTDAAGLYQVSDLPVGQYEVTVMRKGFATFTTTGITLAVGAASVQNFTLSVGEAQEKVTVQAGAVEVQSTTSQLGALVDQQQMRELPLNGRNFQQLILLAPGVAPANTGIQGAMYGRAPAYSTSGARPEGEAILLDGTNTVNFWNHGTGASMLGTSLGVEAIDEFQMLTNTYSAEFGGFGSAINAVSKSGTNSLHGSAYEFIRNSELNARNYFDPLSGPPAFRRNQFGGSVGGPIKENSIFFFVNYEGLRQDLGETYTATVPSAAAWALAPSGSPILQLQQFYPSPNGQVSGLSGKYTDVGFEPLNEDYFLARLDYQLRSKDSIFARFVRDAGNLSDPFPNAARGGLLPFWPEGASTHNYDVTIEEKHLADSSLVNVARVSFVRTNQGTTSPVTNDVLDIFPGENRPDSDLSVTGLSALGPLANDPFYYLQQRYTYEDQVYWTHGAHDLRFGGFIQRQLTDGSLGLYKGGAWTFTSISNLMANKPAQVQGPLPGAENARRIFGELDFVAYIEDNWKVRRDLILNLGLRYEPTTNPAPESGTQLNAIVNPQTDTSYTPVSHALAQNCSSKNIDPRVGLAYTPFGNQKTVIRAGFGIFHELIAASVYGGTYFTAPPYLLSIQLHPVFPNAFTSVGPPSKLSTIVALAHSTDTGPYIMQWNLNAERQLSPSLIATAAYVGSRANHIYVSRDLNPVVDQISNGSYYFPNGTIRVNPVFSSLYQNVAGAESNYNGLQLGLKGQPIKSLQVQLYYTWSKTLSDADNSTNSQANNGSAQEVNPYNISYDYGLSSFDIGQNLIGNVIYDVPFKANRLVSGYELTLIPTVHSGPPYSANIGYDDSNLGSPTLGERPNVVGNPNAPGPVAANPNAACQSGGIAVVNSVHNANNWFNPCAFAVPAAGTLGNLGRNSLIGPGTVNFDMSLSKATKITERLNVQFRAECFNILNHANFALPNSFSVFGAGSTVPLSTSTAGQIVATSTTSRQMQFGLKFLF
jgi:hypothetical protein